MNMPKLRDETEVLIAAIIGAVVGGFSLYILFMLGMVEPLVLKQPVIKSPSHSELGRCPDCHLEKQPESVCSGLTHQDWIKCVDAEHNHWIKLLLTRQGQK